MQETINKQTMCMISMNETCLLDFRLALQISQRQPILEVLCNRRFCNSISYQKMQPYTECYIKKVDVNLKSA